MFNFLVLCNISYHIFVKFLQIARLNQDYVLVKYFRNEHIVLIKTYNL